MFILELRMYSETYVVLFNSQFMFIFYFKMPFYVFLFSYYFILF